VRPSGAHQEDHRETHLRRQQEPPPAAARPLAAPGAQAAQGVRPAGPPCGQEAEEQRRAEAERRADQQRFRARRNGQAVHPDAAGQREAAEHGHGGARHPEGGHAAKPAEHQRLHAELAEEAAAPRAQCGAHGQVPLPLARPHKQQVGHVDARHEQGEAHHARQEQEEALEVGPAAGSGGGARGNEGDRLRHVLRRGEGAPRLVEARRRHLHGDAGRQARGHVEEAGEGLRQHLGNGHQTSIPCHGGPHAHGHPQIGRRGQVESPEPTRRHTHDGEGCLADVDGGADHLRIGVVATPPEVVREDGHRARAPGALVRGAEQTSQCRLHPHHLEIAPRYQASLAHLRPFPHAELNLVIEPRRHFLHPCVRLPQPAVGDVGQAAGRTVRIQRVEDLYQPLRLVHRQRPQQHRVHQREDGHVGANAERQGEDHQEGEAGATPERAQGLSQIRGESVHGVARAKGGCASMGVRGLRPRAGAALRHALGEGVQDSTAPEARARGGTAPGRPPRVEERDRHGRSMARAEGARIGAEQGAKEAARAALSGGRGLAHARDVSAGRTPARTPDATRRRMRSSSAAATALPNGVMR